MDHTDRPPRQPFLRTALANARTHIVTAVIVGLVLGAVVVGGVFIVFAGGSSASSSGSGGAARTAARIIVRQERRLMRLKLPSEDKVTSNLTAALPSAARASWCVAHRHTCQARAPHGVLIAVTGAGGNRGISAQERADDGYEFSLSWTPSYGFSRTCFASPSDTQAGSQCSYGAW